MPEPELSKVEAGILRPESQRPETLSLTTRSNTERRDTSYTSMFQVQGVGRFWLLIPVPSIVSDTPNTERLAGVARQW